jgi:hypothetical protein
MNREAHLKHVQSLRWSPPQRSRSSIEFVTGANDDSGFQRPAIPWREPGWLDDVTAWIGSHLELAGPIERKKTRKWSVVLRVPTVDGDHWFKEVGPMLAFEPALTAALARHAPRYLPDVLAAEGSRLLMRDAGEQLIKRGGAADARSPLWEEIVARHAELQIELVPVAAKLPAPDRRSETLIRHFGVRVEPLVAALGDAIPMTIVHLDVSHKNVRFRAGAPVLLDWAAGVVAHPFFGLGRIRRSLVHFGAAPAGPEVLRVQDAYLEPWTTFAPPRELRRILTAANALRQLCRSASKEAKLAAKPAAVRERYEQKVESRLQGFAARRELSDA